MHAGMSAGLPKYITVNLSTFGAKFSDGDEVSLESLTQKRLLNLSGREAKLPLKVHILIGSVAANSFGGNGINMLILC